ncbi:MAG: GntR family transcriptional regulator [Myxococcota bacterium]|nr:GntR family transcriptional regulator [Myxococcota bacterium]
MSDPKTHSSRLTDRLREEILSGAVPPASKLKLAPLAERFEVSRGPLREAATRLVSEGLVTLEDQRGFTVAGISREDLLDLTQTRQRIEVLALRDAIQHGDLAWEGRVMAACHMLDRVTPPTGTAGFTNRHAEFHRELVSACPSAYLLNFREQLYALTQRYRNLAAHLPAGKRDIRAEHWGIAEAAVSRDAEGACRRLQDHLHRTATALLENYPELFGSYED